MATPDSNTINPQEKPNPLADLLAFHVGQIMAINATIKDAFKKDGKTLLVEPFDDANARVMLAALKFPLQRIEGDPGIMGDFYFGSTGDLWDETE